MNKNDDYYLDDHRQNFHICGIILHSEHTDYGIYSVYRPQSADPTQIFSYPFECDKYIIGGDFNIHHELWGSKHSSSKGTQFVNVLNQSNLNLLNKQTPTREDPSTFTQSAIDLTLVTTNIPKVDWSVHQHNHNPSFSDHFNIFISVPLNSHPDDKIYHSTWNLCSNTKWKKFRNKLESNLKKPFQTTDPNKQAQSITHTIYNTAISTIGYRKYLRGYKPWWNSQINQLKTEVKHLKRKLDKIKSKYPDSYITIPKFQRMLLEYKSIQQHKIQSIRIAKKIHHNKINEYLSKTTFNDKLSWRLLNLRHNTKNNDIPPLNHKDQIILDPIHKAEILHNVLSNPPPPDLENKHIQFHNKISNIIQNTMNTININHNTPNNSTTIDTLNNPIQKYEILNCIKKLQKDKAYGPDMIHNLMIIKGDHILLTKLVILFNNCLRKGAFPEVWNYANIHPIPKPKKVHSDPKNYRPIAVSSCLGRIFEKTLANRLQQFCVQHQIFKNNQCGFQINRNTEDVLSNFINDAYTAIDKKTDMDCIFTDFSKAYDSVWHQGLLYKLYHKYKIKGNFFKCITNFLTRRYTRVLTKKGASPWKLQSKGLPQGSSLSPMLYILYTNDFRIKYSNFIKMGCFADDTALWTKPSTLKLLKYKYLQKEVNRFIDWTKYWQLSINPTKCSLIKIHKHIKQPPQLYQRGPLNPVQSCRYLFHIDQSQIP